MSQFETYGRMPRESVTNGIPVITTDHANIHSKMAFTVANKFSLAAAGIGYLEIRTPATGYVHFKPAVFQSDGPKVTVELIEAPTLTTGPTAVVPVCRNRVGTPPASAVVVKNNPTAFSAGTVLDIAYLGGGTGAGGSAVSGASADNDNEWVLKPSTVYALRVTNGGTAAAVINVSTFWYEESAT